jgi:hypothetical protein
MEHSWDPKACSHGQDRLEWVPAHPSDDLQGHNPCTGPAQPKNYAAFEGPQDRDIRKPALPRLNAGENNHDGADHMGIVFKMGNPGTQEELAGLTIGLSDDRAPCPRLNRAHTCAIGTGAHDMITNREGQSRGCRGPCSSYSPGCTADATHNTPGAPTHSAPRQPRGGEHGE